MGYERRAWSPSNLSRDQQAWRREVEQRIEGVERAQYRGDQGDLNGNKGQNSSMEQISRNLALLPVPVAAAAAQPTTPSFGLSTGPKTVQVNIPIPPNKTKVALTAIGNAAVLDQTSGGLAVANASIEAGGLGFSFATPYMTASKDAGASKVNNILTPALGFEQENLTGTSILVALTVSASNLAAFTPDGGNYITLTVTAIFFN